MRRMWQQTLGSERGSALLIGLSLIMIMTLLGVALFEMTTIEASLVTKDGWELQAFYCAEAQAARILNLYNLQDPKNPTGDGDGTRQGQTFPDTTMRLGNGDYTFNGSATVDPVTQVVTVTATCAMPWGPSPKPTRTVVWTGTRQFDPNPRYRNAVLGGGINPANGNQEFLGDLFLGGSGVPVNSGGNYVLGADTVNGKVYVAGNAYLNGQSAVNTYGAGDTGPRITVYAGKSVVDNSTGFDSTVPGSTAQSTLNPMPSLSNPQGTGKIDEIQAAVNPGGTPVMKGAYGGTTVYNLTEIFRQLGQTSEGNSERNLARPTGCTFGTASVDPKCQVWQDLVIIGPKQTCAPICMSGLVGPSDKPSYFFMGLPRSPSLVPQSTSFNAIFDAAVKASAELRQLGFVAGNYPSIGTRLDSMLGTNIDGEGKADRLVDLTVGVDPATGQSVLRSAPPIFYVDGYWRVDGGTAGLAYNGRGVVVSSKSMIVSDNLLYLGGLSNVNLDVPPSTGTCASAGSGATFAASCGQADMLGLMAKEDIWMGDSNGLVHEISAIMLAGRDVNFFDYTSAATCCRGPSNPVTFNGTVMATRQAALIRDWAYPNADHLGPEAQCNSAAAGCRPVAFFPGDNSCGVGVVGCWKFMKLDTTTGILSVDSTLASFKDGCVTTSVSPLAPASCAVVQPGSRRVTHFQLNVNYDSRLQDNPGLIPIGLPPGGNAGYQGFVNTARWKDCRASSTC
jgi:hypothetical protein